MPVSASIDREKSQVRVRFENPYTLDEWQAAIAPVFADPTLPLPLRMVFDRRDTAAPTKAFVDGSLAFLCAQEVMDGAKIAVLVNTPAAFGMARMASILVEVRGEPTDLQPFYSEAEADAWLAK